MYNFTHGTQLYGWDNHFREEYCAVRDRTT